MTGSMGKFKPQIQMDTIVFNKKALLRAQNKATVDGLNELMEILFEARGCYELWWAYLQLKGQKENIHALLKLKSFFETSGRAYISHLTVSLYKLYERRGDVWNVEDLIHGAEKILDEDEKQQIQRLLLKAKVIWKKIAKLRHNFFAHRNNQLSREAVYKIAKITPNEFRDLTVLSLGILNLISSKVYSNPREFNGDESKDITKIFGILKAQSK